MPLKLVTGPANSAKAGVVLGELRARLAEEPVLVVPSFEDVEHSQRELAERGAVFGARVVRFDWLFALIAERVGTPELLRATVASDVQRELIVEQAVRSARLSALRGSAERPGFTRAAVRFVAELGRSMVEPERLGRALDEWAAGGPRRRYASEVASLYAGYRAGLDAAGLVDEELYAWRALDALRREPRRFGAAPVFFYGFDDFTPLELDAIETLAGRVGVDVVVSLPYEPGRAAFMAVAEVHEHLRSLASEHEHLEAVSDHYAPASRAALHHLERGLFGAGPSAEPGEAASDRVEPDAVGGAKSDAGEGAARRVEPGDAVRLHSAGGERAEIELAGAEVLQLLRTGTPPGEVAVVFRSPRRYASVVEQVFGAFGIPFSIDRSVPLEHTALGSGLLALIDCALGASRSGGAGADGSAAATDGAAPGPTATADDLLAYLRTPGRLERPGLADALEARVRQEGATSAERASELWEELVPAFALTEIDRLRAARGARAFLAELDRQLERLFAAPYRRDAHVFAAEELDDPRVFRAAREAIAEMHAVAEAADGPELTAARVRDTLARLQVRLGENPQPDRVQVADPESIRARRFQAVLVCGLGENEFPHRARPDPFLPDDDRRAIAAASGLRLPVREEQLGRERYLFYVCASRAERRLVLSSRTSDEEGAPETESFFLSDVRDLFTGALDSTRRTRSLSDVTWSAPEAPTLLEWERALALAGPRRSPPPPERLTADEVLAELREGRAFSASALEMFADCPVKWLVERLLRPDALEPDPEQMVRGSYAHDVLELTYRRLRERTGSARVTPATLSEAEAALIAALEERRSAFQISPKQTRVRAAVRKLEFDLLRYLRRESRRETSFEPEHLELEFGGEEAVYPAVPLAGLDGVEIRGRIDRVDTHAGRALVIDYKSGKSGYPVDRWQRDHRLQVALYMLAVEELLGLEPAGGVYQPLSGSKPDARGLLCAAQRDDLGGEDFKGNDWKDGPEFRDLLEAARETARGVVERIRSGEVRPCPDSCGWAGSGCSYPAICREERVTRVVAR